jgi:hypothetical protein
VSDASGFGKLVPGFDFLQSLVKNAGNALPGIGQWVAPTLDPAELDKRIGELRTVQFWLEQNARMLATTIQALEVQRMTLTTLKSMNVPMADLTESLKIKPMRGAPAAPRLATKKEGGVDASAKKEASSAPSAVDPMQWWSALTNQFAQLATNAIKETANDAAKGLAGGLAKPSGDNAAAARETSAAPARKSAARRGRAKPAAKRSRNAGDAA